MSLALVEGCEKGEHSGLVSLLRGGYTALVHPVVDGIVMPLMHLVNLLLEGRGIQGYAPVSLLNQVIKLHKLNSKYDAPCANQARVKLTSVPSMRSSSLLSLFTMTF